MKDMLTDEDIARIGVEVARVIEDNVDPQFDSMGRRLDGVEKRLDGVEKRLTKAEALMVTKDYLDDKLADLRGEFNVRLKGIA